MMKVELPARTIRYCGADCAGCDSYRQAKAGDFSRLVNPETKYRCCWVPIDCPEGKDCEIKTCCEARDLMYCGQCAVLESCDRMREFYSKPGYDRLRQRMFREMARTRLTAVGACGDWCGKCPHFQNNCARCSSKADECKFLKCLAGRDLEHCGECSDFPCEDLVSFVPDDRLPKGFHIESLRYRAEKGIEKWLQRFPQEWRHLVR